MEKDFGFGNNKRLHLLSPTLNLSGFPFMNSYLNTEPAHRYPHAVEDSPLRNLPLIPGYDFQQTKASEAIKLQNWFNHKPHFQQAFAPVSNSASKNMFPSGQSDMGQQGIPMTGSVPSEKRFLVFDQSGDKTTLLYSSGVHTPVQFGACRAPNPPTTHNLIKEELRDSYYPLRLRLNDENVEEDNLRDVSEDEIHEDTEELDALLWSSDDDSDSSEDDETSTGHSPSTMTDNGMPKLVDETGEEVNSISVPTKRQKLLDGLDDVPSNRFAASSLKTFACSELESDAESSRGSRSNQHKEESFPRPGCKRSRRDKIHETVNILQSIIPDANGKDAIVIIDQAIHYLRSLKVKAKAMGLDAI